MIKFVELGKEVYVNVGHISVIHSDGDDDQKTRIIMISDREALIDMPVAEVLKNIGEE